MNGKENYNIMIDIGGTKLRARKWKGKDKKEFLKEMDSNPNSRKILDILVYNCLDEKSKIALTDMEIKYVLGKIREKSLGDELEFDFHCDSCKFDFKEKRKINDVLVPININNKNRIIKTENNEIKIGRIKNKDFYFDAIEENPDEKDTIEFLLSIDELNKSQDFTFESLMDFFDDLDLDELDSILDQWDNIKFKLNEVHSVVCPECKHEMKYLFDELPDFFPTKWFKE